MNSALIVAVVLIGLGCEVAGILIGVVEIITSRRAALELSDSVSTIYLSGSAALTASATGSATLIVSPGHEETEAEREKRRQDELEAQVVALRREMEERDSKLEKTWRNELQAFATVNQHTTDDLRTALKKFGTAVAAGKWRRYAAVILLVIGAVLQAYAAIVGALCPSGHILLIF
jgi:hypothetical protein